MMPSLKSCTTLLALLLLLLSTSCDDYKGCIKGDYLFLRYIHNGQNAIFGEHSVVDRDSIFFSTFEGVALPDNLSFVDSTMAIRILLGYGQNMGLLHFGNLRTDTFQVTKWSMPYGRDCPIFVIEVALLNGVAICDLNCGDVMDVIF